MALEEIIQQAEQSLDSLLESVYERTEDVGSYIIPNYI